MEIITDIEQGSEEWLRIRLGRVTASNFSTVMAKGRGKAPSKTRKTYMLKLAGEIITGELADGFTNHHMERGHVMEIEARNLYELITGVEVEQVAFIKSGDGMGYSPDGLPDDGLLEIKSKLPHLQIALLMRDEIPGEHIHQLQGGLYVAEREWIDFMSYWPGLPPFIKRVYRDEKFICELANSIQDFIGELNDIVCKIKSM